ncbi:hypothetical protein WA026_007759 [Henosepilachna vigintioctopunctata]|uniref:Uncharacterized protein n=1 Tax=Henosepilachna vigintioctopunctata TaxID=420089 RepID=A0AAW1U487_9CUCU
MSGVIYKKIKENSKIYRIQVNTDNRSLSLVVLEETKEEFNAYKTSLISNQELRKQAVKRGIDAKNYYDKLIFFFENPDKAKFTFDKQSLSISETINKNIQAQYFQCDIHKVDNFSSSLGKFVDQIQDAMSESQKNHSKLTEKYNLMEREVGEYKKKLTELIDRKNVDEQVMLSNFVSLLNEKKRRIQHLNELLEAYQTNRSLVNPVGLNISYRNKRKRINIKNEEPSYSKVLEEVSDSSLSSNDDHYTTDSEKGKATGRVKSEVTDADHSSAVVSNHSSDDDIFEIKPNPLIILPNISREVCNSKYIPTMMVDDCGSGQDNTKKLKSAEDSSEVKFLESKCFNTSYVDINTQDLVDGL